MSQRLLSPLNKRYETKTFGKETLSNLCCVGTYYIIKQRVSEVFYASINLFDMFPQVVSKPMAIILSFV